MRARARSASATCSNTTAYDDPLPGEDRGRAGRGLDLRAGTRPRRGSTCSAAGCRSFVVVVRAAERRPTPGTRRRSSSRTAASRPRRRARASRPARARRRCRGRARTRRACRTARRRRAPRAIAGSASSATSTAAASAEPPPSPAPDGMPLCSAISTRRAARVGGAPREVRRVGRHAAANGPVIVSEVARPRARARARRAAR